MRIEIATQIALEKRRELQAQARSIGVSEEYISELVDTFYERVRAHPELGPVFDEVIRDNWPKHLTRMKLFWSSIALRTGKYRGNPMPVHKALTNAQPEHFVMWLDLFKQTLVDTAPTPEATEYFMGFANAMGDRLSKAMFS